MRYRRRYALICAHLHRSRAHTSAAAATTTTTTCSVCYAWVWFAAAVDRASVVNDDFRGASAVRQRRLACGERNSVRATNAGIELARDHGRGIWHPGGCWAACGIHNEPVLLGNGIGNSSTRA